MYKVSIFVLILMMLTLYLLVVVQIPNCSVSHTTSRHRGVASLLGCETTTTCGCNRKLFVFAYRSEKV